MGKEEKVPAVAENTAEWYEEKVPVRLFRDNAKYKDDVFVAVNGKSFCIQRGVTVEIPRYVATVLEQSMEQDERAAIMMDERAGEFAAESRAQGL